MPRFGLLQMLYQSFVWVCDLNKLTPSAELKNVVPQTLWRLENRSDECREQLHNHGVMALWGLSVSNV